MRRIYILPNLFTAGCLFSGMLAVFAMIDGRDPTRAIHLLMLAGVCDVLDGLVARMTRTQSAFGLNFDSLADVVSFCATPAVIIYLTISGANPILARSTCGLYVVCGAMRLARYNVQAAREESKAFLGMPTPGAAGVIMSVFWVLTDYPALSDYLPIDKVFPPLMVICAWLMVSKFQYYGIKSLRVSGRQPFEMLVILVVMISLLMVLKDHLNIVLVCVMIPYMLSGPVIHYRRGAGKAGSPSRERASTDPRAS